MTHFPTRHRVLRALSLSLAAMFVGVVACDTASSPKSAFVTPNVADSGGVVNDQTTPNPPKPLSSLLKNGSVKQGLTVTTPKSVHQPVHARMRLSQLQAWPAPLVLVNGVEVKKPETGKISSTLDQIDPNTIASIDVEKGPSVIKAYGARAAGGVIFITLKKK